MPIPDRGSANATQPYGDRVSLADALDRILHRGISVQGNVTIGLADVDLLYLDLRLLLGSVDAIWPDGRPSLAFPRPRTPPPVTSDGERSVVAGKAPAETFQAAIDREPSVPNDSQNDPGSSTAKGLVRLVLTVVKLLHDVLERQAGRRMETGRLTEAQIEQLGLALLSQAEEILLLQEKFGFSDQDLSLALGVPNGAS
jgi:hypothetical protein